jgi:hypothetical protein
MRITDQSADQSTDLMASLGALDVDGYHPEPNWPSSPEFSSTFHSSNELWRLIFSKQLAFQAHVRLQASEFVGGMSTPCDNLYRAVDLTVRCSFLGTAIAQP